MAAKKVSSERIVRVTRVGGVLDQWKVEGSVVSDGMLKLELENGINIFYPLANVSLFSSAPVPDEAEGVAAA